MTRPELYRYGLQATIIVAGVRAPLESRLISLFQPSRRLFASLA